MRTLFLFAAMLILNWTEAAESPLPLQIEARVPFAATVFPSAGHEYVVYELYLTNFSGGVQNLRRIEVLDAEKTAAKPVATFEGKQLGEILERGAVRLPSDRSDLHQMNIGTTVVAYMWVPFDSAAHVPPRLQHRVVTDDSSLEGAVVGTHRSELHVLAPPMHGAGWTLSDGPSNVPENHHRRGIFALNGQVTISRRFAADWMLQKDGKDASGDPLDRTSYYSYGQTVYAVDDATVVIARDGQPDNVPRWRDEFHTAVPITMDTLGGNRVALDLGGGQYAWYFHLQPGSVRVKVGDHVRRGQPMAKIGCSGDARAPHLHFEVTTSAAVLGGEGVPYVIDRYRVWNHDNAWETRSKELPLDGMRVDFGGAYSSN